MDNKNLFKIRRCGGGEGIRTPGRSFLLQRFSKPPPSATRPPLRRGHEIKPVKPPTFRVDITRRMLSFS
jgi:hypothetical protein